MNILILGTIRLHKDKEVNLPSFSQIGGSGKALGVPDYSKMYYVGATDALASDTGYFIVFYYAAEQYATYVYINGVQVEKEGQGHASGYFSCLLPVKRGDAVALRNYYRTEGIYFVPVAK